MTASPSARTTLDIARPVAAVRAAFFDLDFAIETQPHHGVVLSWVDAAAKRLREETRVLERAIVDECIIEEGADGAWVKRVVDGSNLGARYEATFVDLGESTRVELVAYAPKSGFSHGLGRLSSLGVEKALRKMLSEKEALVRAHAARGEEASAATALPTNPAAGEVVARVLEPLGSALELSGRSLKALVSLFLEAASVVAVADDVADDAEREVLDGVASALCQQQLDAEAKARLIDAAQKGVAAEGTEKRCASIGARLKTVGHAELGLGIAILVAEASHGIDAGELAALKALAAGAGVSDDALTTLVERVTRALESAREAKAA